MQQLIGGLRAILFLGTFIGATASVVSPKGTDLAHHEAQHAGLSGHLVNLLQSIYAEGGEVATGINVSMVADLKDALTDVEGEAEEGLNKDAIENLVAELSSFEANASKATPGAIKFVEKVTKMIDEDMAVKVKAAHKQTQTVADTIVRNFASCAASKRTADNVIGKMMKTAKKSSKDHKSCRTVESRRFLSKSQCLSLLKAKKSLMDSEKKKLELLRRSPNTEANVCHPAKSMYYGIWLERNFRYFANREKLFLRQKLKWQKAKVDHDRYKPVCMKIVKGWTSKKAVCSAQQKTLEGSTCGAAKLMFSSCDQRYWGCYEESVDMYKSTVPLLKKQEKDRKTEWRALMRIKCLLGVFGKGEANPKKINECKKITHSTKHLNLKIKPVPGPQKCKALPNTPCSTSFYSQEYRRLPRYARSGKCSQCVVFSSGFPTRPVYWLTAKNYQPDTDCWTNRGKGPGRLCNVHRTGTRPWLKRSKGNGAARPLLALHGTSSTGLWFGNVMPSRYTICTLSRYTGGRKGRLFTSHSPNWLHGHWNNQAGVAYYSGWKTHPYQRKDVKKKTNWLAMCGRNGGRTPGNIMSNGNFKGKGGGGARPSWVAVNMGAYRGEYSDFAIAEVVIFEEHLPDQEMTKVMNHLLSKLKKKRKQGPDKSYRSAATTCTAPQLSKLDRNSRDRKTFRCGDGACIMRKGMCNGYKNCRDGSDETICKRLLTKPNKAYKNPARTCTVKQRLKLKPGMGDLRTFRCWDGTCTHITGKCNGFSNCGDGSDEKKCYKFANRKKAKKAQDGVRMVLKYTTRWPHCTNLRCFANTKMKDAVKTCRLNKKCDGFSFTRTRLYGGKGGGCYKKNCKVDKVRGFGKGSHGYFKKMVKAATAKCKHILVKYPVWGYKNSRGVDLSPYTKGLKWIGCVGNGCRGSHFYCKNTATTLEFGVKTNNVMRSLIGDDVPTRYSSCASSNRPMDIGNAPLRDDAADALCKDLGYKRGRITKRLSSVNWCPYVIPIKGDKKKGLSGKFSLYWKSQGTKPKPATKIKCWGVKPRLSTKASMASSLGLKQVNEWTDTEKVCRTQIPKNAWGACAKKKATKIGIDIEYASGYHGFAYYTDMGGKWGQKFPAVQPKISTGFFKGDPTGPLYKLDFKSASGTYYPIAWSGLANKWTRNFDLTTAVRNCNDGKADSKGWGTMKVKLFCN